MAGHLKECALAVALVCVTGVAAGAAAPPRTGGEAALTEGSLPELGPESTLQDYLRYAAAANPGLEAARRRWEAAAEESARARALPEPQLSFSRVVRPAASGDGPREQRLALSQGFPWFGTLAARGAAADAGAGAAGREYEQARLELAFRVKTAYAEYYYLGRALEIARDHVDLVAHLEAVARTRYRSGSATHSAVVQAQVELGRLEDQRRGLEAQRAPAMARLNAALDRAPEAVLPWPGSLEVPEAPFTDAEAMDRLAQGNADLGRLDWLARERQQGVRLARKAYYPELMLGVEYTANPASMAGGSRDPVMAMATVSLPIWRGSYRAAERQARLQGAAVQAERAEA
ncbi:MAG: TolC family protein, partial [Gemmatimonadota bacterium]